MRRPTVHSVIVGTGPAAAAAILALADDPSERITVIDIGERLADDTAAAVERMSALQPGYTEYYNGSISKFGADIGYLSSAVIVWEIGRAHV